MGKKIAWYQLVMIIHGQQLTMPTAENTSAAKA
jgi:hypothetical protein